MDSPLSSDGTQQPRPETKDKEAMKDWAAIENEMLQHDGGRMEGHAKDVDTLLVFAGLLSAVLTAFVVESYQQLQVDTGQKSMVILQRISIQLESFTLFQSGSTSPSNVPPPLPILGPTVQLTERWLNILWFLSLIFALAAALFGILVKQWIREYMQWNAALASPKENVLVRQVRFDAWKDWNVTATIAAIPALLETAVVFFVSGLILLLWTLDPVVSIVISIAVAVFLLIASTFTILPAFFKRCPYKSPTAWAFAFVWDCITLSILSLSDRLALFAQGSHEHGLWLRWRLEHWHVLKHNWRDRDIANLWNSAATATHRDPMEAIYRASLAASASVQEPGERSIPLEDVGWRDYGYFSAAEVDHILRTITEVPPLIHALSWVSLASQTGGLGTTVARCIHSLQSGFDVSTRAGRTAHYLSLWHLPLALEQARFGNGMSKLLKKQYKTLISVRSGLRVFCPDTRGTSQSLSANPSHYHFLSMTPWWQDTPWDTVPEIFLINHFLALSVTAAVKEMIIQGTKTATILSSRGQGRRVMELIGALSVLCQRVSQTVPAPTNPQSQWNIGDDASLSPLSAVALLAEAYNAASSSNVKPDFDLVFPGIRWAILHAICRACAVRMDGNQIRTLGMGTPLTPDFWQLDLALTLEVQTREDLHIVTNVFNWCMDRDKIIFNLYYGRYNLRERVALLLDKMCLVAEMCIEHEFPNCGSYNEFPWPILHHWKRPRNRYTSHFLSSNFEGFIRLLLLLVRADELQLLTGFQVYHVRELRDEFLHARIQHVPSYHSRPVRFLPVHSRHQSGKVTAAEAELWSPVSPSTDIPGGQHPRISYEGTPVDEPLHPPSPGIPDSRASATTTLPVNITSVVDEGSSDDAGRRYRSSGEGLSIPATQLPISPRGPSFHHRLLPYPASAPQMPLSGRIPGHFDDEGDLPYSRGSNIGYPSDDGVSESEEDALLSTQPFRNRPPPHGALTIKLPAHGRPENGSPIHDIDVHPSQDERSMPQRRADHTIPFTPGARVCFASNDYYPPPSITASNQDLAEATALIAGEAVHEGEEAGYPDLRPAHARLSIAALDEPIGADDSGFMEGIQGVLDDLISRKAKGE